jgi:hypothetical protein
MLSLGSFEPAAGPGTVGSQTHTATPPRTSSGIGHDPRARRPSLMSTIASAERYGVEPRLLKSPEYRLRDWSFLTAIPRAFFCPTNTSNRLARVIPV